MAHAHVDAISLEVFHNRCAAIAEEMGVALGRSAFSANIKERRDYSCAVFDPHGRMLAQAAHVPVHLGAMPRSVAAALAAFSLQPGDVVALNDPYLGGSHLPDITLVSPVHSPTSPNDTAPVLLGYVASRAHHSDVGGIVPGSMPLSREIYQEGLIIPPVLLQAAGTVNTALVDLICRNSRTPTERRGDLAAQLACHQLGSTRLADLAAQQSIAWLHDHMVALLAYGARHIRALIADLPDGTYQYTDWLDDDGAGTTHLPIQVTLTTDGEHMRVDFAGTAPQSGGPVNAPLAVVESAVYYCLRCLGGTDLPTAVVGALQDPSLSPVQLDVPHGSLLNPAPPAAVAGGNVETSQRVVDVVFGALAQAVPALVPAAATGSMNNWTFGGVDTASGRAFAYYETMGGGTGAWQGGHGLDGVQVHMTNTLNTPIEALERAFPLRVERYSLRPDSGGAGQWHGGDGLVRAIRFLQPVTLTLLTERRHTPPYGLAGGAPGACGHNTLTTADGTTHTLPPKHSQPVQAGDVLTIATPGGGGWGTPPPAAPPSDQA